MPKDFFTYCFFYNFKTIFSSKTMNELHTNVDFASGRRIYFIKCNDFTAD